MTTDSNHSHMAVNSTSSFYDKLEILQRYDRLVDYDKTDVIRHFVHQYLSDLHQQHRAPDREEKIRHAMLDLISYL